MPKDVKLFYGWSSEGKFVLLVQDEEGKILHRISLTPGLLPRIQEAMNNPADTRTHEIAGHRQLV
jgi:DNA-directed RNA polymerase subunit H (RpoH/RPB5)